MKDLEPREWGFWTRYKLEILRRYLKEFTTAGKNKSREFIYFDLFAGQTKNRERDSKKAFDGSAIIAMKTDEPPFTRLRLFEKEHSQELEENLKDYEDRDVKVIPGDCNDEIGKVLSDLSQYNRAPTFAFIDPNGPDCHWSTLESLARFKNPESRFKTEIWLLFADGMFTRNLLRGGKISPAWKERMTRMFGTKCWIHIYEARCNEQLDPSDARTEYVNLMRWRLEKQLRYKWTHTLQVFNKQNSPLYHLIFATDNKAGNDIMSYLYKKALEKFPIIQMEAKELHEIRRKEKTGEKPLFDTREAGEIAAPRAEIVYVREPPWDPHQTGWYRHQV